MQNRIFLQDLMNVWWTEDETQLVLGSLQNGWKLMCDGCTMGPLSQEDRELMANYLV
jgi:hypothetical protein